MATITINGMTITGKSISINSGRLSVDGNVINLADDKVFNITVNGDVDRIEADACDRIEVHGAVTAIKTLSGDVRCGDVHGAISTMSGDVTCASHDGPISTMSGDILTSQPA